MGPEHPLSQERDGEERTFRVLEIHGRKGEQFSQDFRNEGSVLSVYSIIFTFTRVLTFCVVFIFPHHNNSVKVRNWETSDESRLVEK